MQCSKEILARLFYNVSSSFQLLFLFSYITTIFLFKLFLFLGGNPFSERNQDGNEYGVFTDEEEEEEEEEEEAGYFGVESVKVKDDLVADIIQGGQSLSFLHRRGGQTSRDQFFDEGKKSHEHINAKEVLDGSGCGTEEQFSSVCNTPPSESEYILEDVVDDDDDDEETRTRDADSNNDSRAKNRFSTYTKIDGKFCHGEIKNEKMSADFTSDEKFLIFAPPKLETNEKKLQAQEKENDVDDDDDDEEKEKEIFGDSCTVGSTSKSSSEWRSSINCRDSVTEDPFSSSSRRSCPKWESYTVFQKYDEEMLFLDRISAQKLHETESLRSIQACPRSISERIVHKIATSSSNKKSSDFRRNPYHELEAAYVAQICLTWEALNWNYNYFKCLRASRRQVDPGCPAYVAQQFQQFQVLLQRYVENEPYEHGRRPEIYARMRSLAPKLLQVPEYRDSAEEKREEGFGSRIPSDSFLVIMEEAIRTFMNFLKADRGNRCQILADFFRRNKRGLVDPTLLMLLKKVNKKKKLKLKDLRRAGKCLRKRRLKEEEEMEILMAQIDLKVASRVLRMTDLNEQQLNWCEGKMSKVRIGDGKLHRDSSPLFFPAH